MSQNAEPDSRLKLVIYDAAWPLYQPLLARELTTRWDIRSNANHHDWLLHEISDADALIALRLPEDARALATRLKMVHFPGAGVMHHDPAELPSGCCLCNVYEHEIPIAEYIVMVMLMQVTQIRRYTAAFGEGRWDGTGRVGGEPHDEAFGKTIGMIGYGHIGQAVAERARAFGLRTLAVRQNNERPLPPTAPVPDFLGSAADLDHILKNSDFLVIACPLTSSSRGMIGPDQLRAMKRGAMLINVSRAEIVQEAPLYEALASGRLAAAALDVWYQYPLGPGELMHGSKLPFHQLPNVICTPHLSAWTGPMLERRLRLIASNLDRIALGMHLDRVVLVGQWKPA